jgi:Virulence factor BrkB
MAASADIPRNRAPDQISLTKSLFIIGTAGVLNLLLGPPAASTKEDRPFGETQSGQERTQIQLRRAREPGRGRRAASPIQIPWKGWKDIFWRTVNQASEDRLLAIAAGVVFYGLLALFPAVTALVSCYGLFTKPDSINDHLSFLQDVMPAEAYSIVQDQIARVIAKGQAGLSLGFAGGLLLALWSANAGMKALMDALNIVNEEKEKRSFIRLNLVSLAFTVAGIFAVLAAVGAVVVAPLLLSPVGLARMSEQIVRFARWPALLRPCFWGYLSCTDMVPAAAQLSGNGSVSAPSLPPSPGSLDQRRFHTTSPILPTTTRPMVRSARPSGP